MLSSSPYGNKPRNLEPVVAQVEVPTAPAVPKSAVGGSGEGGSPVPQSLTSVSSAGPADQAESELLGELRQGGGSPEELSRSPAGSAESSGAGDGGERELLAELSGAAGASPGKPAGVGGAAEMYGVVQQPDGSFGVREGDKVRALTSQEKEAAGYIAQALRIGGPTIGALVGGAAGMGLAGPAGAAVLEGTGAVTGGNLAHEPASFYERLAGQKPEERGVLQKAVEATAGPVGGAVAGSLAKSGLVRAAEKEAAPLIRAGEQAITARAAERVKAADEAALKLRSDQINMENPKVVQLADDLAAGKFGEDKARQAVVLQAQQNQAVLDRYNSIREKVGPVLNEEAQKSLPIKDAFDKLSKNYEREIGGLKGQSYLHAKNERFPVMDLAGTFGSTLKKFGLVDDSGRLFSQNPSEARTLLNKYTQLRETAGAQGGKGLTIQQLDDMTQTAQKLANFDSPVRNPTERAWGEISFEARKARDNAMQQVFGRAGDKPSAERLMRAREFYSTNIDDIRAIQRDLDTNPTDVVRALVKPDDPKRAEFLMQIATREQREQLGGLLLDKIAGDAVDRSQGKFGARAVERELAKYDPKVLDAFLGEQRKDLNKLVNYAKIVESRQLDPARIASDKTVVKAKQLVTHWGRARAAVEFVAGLFSNRPEVAELLTQEIIGVAPKARSGVRGKLGAPLAPLGRAANPVGAAVTTGGVQSLRQLRQNDDQQ